MEVKKPSWVQFSHSVVSDFLQPHKPQHARPPCPSPTAGVYPNPCPLRNAIQPSHPLLSPSPAFNLSQHQGLFKWVSSLQQVAKVLEFQLQHQSFQEPQVQPKDWLTSLLRFWGKRDNDWCAIPLLGKQYLTHWWWANFTFEQYHFWLLLSPLINFLLFLISFNIFKFLFYLFGCVGSYCSTWNLQS